jgi:Xaa-Pro dipeptidase
MNMRRREFLAASAVGALGISLGCEKGDPAAAATQGAAPAVADVPGAIGALKPMRDGIVPISDAERQSRIEKARRLMIDAGISALFLESGSSLFYYTGVRWGTSERMFAMVLPARGEAAWVTPKFEEQRARELIKFSNDIRTWEEDQDPGEVVAGILRDRGISTGRIGVEERLRFFLFDAVRKHAPSLDYALATPVTSGGRMFKSPAEIALMQRANDITIAAFRAALTTLREGMTQFDLRGNIEAAFDALGAPDGSALVGFGQYTAFPHGSIQPQQLKQGDVVLVDGGCSIDGYQSDITRTTVFGEPSRRQTEVWNLEKRAQTAAFDAAKVGVPCEAVDAAARKVITDAGFGPDYKVPGLPHRTGHGIGLDGHEWTNFVRGNKTPLAPGMCFSDEPMIAIYGEFGIRLEDCLYMTESGPRFFSQQSPAIDRPFAEPS